MPSTKYSSLNPRFLRNIGTLTEEQQIVIQNTRIGLAGAGLGSEVGRQLARFGFDITAIADPETVDTHNLNRQNYYQDQIDKSKAESLKTNIQQINPDLDPQTFTDGITEDNIREFVENTDIIIDAIDPTYFHLSLLLTKHAHEQGKAVVTAIDFGLGARLFVFPADGVDIYNFCRVSPTATKEELAAIPTEVLMEPYMAGSIPPYALTIIERVAKNELDYYPQNILAVATAATMITTACKRLALQEPLRTAPEYLHLDVDWILSNHELQAV